MLVNNTTNIFLINPNIVLYYDFFIKYFCISKITVVLTELKSTEKHFILSFNPVFSYQIIKSFEILPIHSVKFFILVSFALN